MKTSTPVTITATLTSTTYTERPRFVAGVFRNRVALGSFVETAATADVLGVLSQRFKCRGGLNRTPLT